MAIPPINHTIIVKASLERVWQALTDPAQVQIWVGAIGFKPEIGAKFEFHAPPQGEWDGITYSELLVLEKPHKMAFSWYVPNTPVTVVEITLRDLGSQTEVTLVHSGWDQFPPEVKPIRDQLDHGWGGFVLPQLAALVESQPV
jgi:uncharacterized protein YndB with AHSA1/START domain